MQIQEPCSNFSGVTAPGLSLGLYRNELFDIILSRLNMKFLHVHELESAQKIKLMNGLGKLTVCFEKDMVGDTAGYSVEWSSGWWGALSSMTVSPSVLSFEIMGHGTQESVSLWSEGWVPCGFSDSGLAEVGKLVSRYQIKTSFCIVHGVGETYQSNKKNSTYESMMFFKGEVEILNRAWDV